MRIGVSGASGQLGQAVISELGQRSTGNVLVGISRTPGKTIPPVEGRRGDYDQPETLAEAYRGIDSGVVGRRSIGEE